MQARWDALVYRIDMANNNNQFRNQQAKNKLKRMRHDTSLQFREIFDRELRKVGVNEK